MTSSVMATRRFSDLQTKKMPNMYVSGQPTHPSSLQKTEEA